MSDPSGRQTPPTFGRFEAVRELGRGGMGVVYLVRDPELGRELALKVPLGEIDAHRLKRMRREGEVTAALDHPGIVRIHEFGVEGGRPYLVYELIHDARPLEQLFPQLSVGQRLELIAQAADALGFAHSQGVVHRDVKPENLLVDGEGRLRVADFGLASAQGAERLTRTGTLMGTLAFMAPEVLSGGGSQAGPSVDVWALGVTLYLALTDELPFLARTVPELASQVRKGATRPSRVVEDVDPVLETVCLRALSTDPGRRYPDAAAFAEALRAAAAGELPAGKIGKLAALGALLVVAVTAAGLVLSRGTAQPPQAVPSPAVAGPAPSETVGELEAINLELAQVQLEHGRQLARRKLPLEQVLPVLEEGLAMVPEGSSLADELTLEIADLLRRRGRWQRCVDVGSTLVDRPGRLGFQACYVVGDALRRLRDLAGAEEVFQRMVDRDPDGPYGLYARVTIGVALQALRESQARGLGRRASRATDLDRKTIRQALDLETDMPFARLMQALLLVQDPETHGDALRILEDLVETEPDDPKVYEVLAIALRRDPPRAIRALKTAIRLTEPDPVPNWLRRLGTLYIRSGRPKAARESFDRLVALEETPAALLLRGVALAQEGHPDKAELDWGRAFALDPDDCLDQLDQLPLGDFRPKIEEALGLDPAEPEPPPGD